MKNKIQSLIFATTVLAGSLVSCTSEPIVETGINGENACRLTFNVTKTGFTGSRDAEEWKNGDCVHLSFVYGDARIDGRAVYDAAADYWTLYYNGQIVNGATGTCRAWYFDGDSNDSGDGVRISEFTCAYADYNGSYTKTIDGMGVTAALTPLSGRVRFTGDAGMTFNILNAKHYYSYRKAEGELLYSSEPLSLIVGDDSSTQYVYIDLPTDPRTLTISYDNLTFHTVCEHPVLDPGLSGYMAIPTKLSHNGWTMVEKTIATLGAVSVSDVDMHTATLSATLLTDGNSPVSETGFCYSVNENPTVSDAKVECPLTIASFGYTLTGLPAKTKYHVRAYAVNGMGIAYSDEVTFMTKGSTPQEDDNDRPHV